MKNGIEQSQERAKPLANLILNSDAWADLKLTILWDNIDPVGLPAVKRAMDLIESLGAEGEPSEGQQKPPELTITGKKKRPPTEPEPTSTGADPDLDESQSYE